MRVLIVEDEPAFREQMVFICQGVVVDGLQPEVEVARNRGEAGTLIPRGWDVIYLDLKLDASGKPSFDLVSLAKKYARQIAVISGDYSLECRLAANEHGCTSFIAKSNSIDAIATIVRLNLQFGQNHFDQVTQAIDLASTQRMKLLSNAELAILELLVQGMTNKEVGRSRGVAEDTIKKQVSSIKKKLGVDRRMDLVHLWNTHVAARTEGAKKRQVNAA